MGISPPVTRQELIARAQSIAGLTIQQLANEMETSIPASTTHAKGWFGKLLELALGANAANAPEPDFVNLGIELKSIPIDDNGKPKESTYICVVQLDPVALSSWESSLVKCKLTEVLWIPVEANKNTPVSIRRIGSPILWQPNVLQEKQLKKDWQELSDMIVLGNIDKISSSMGEYLQIRPKAAHSNSLTKDKNQPGEEKLTLPRGFYLRPSFTHTIISNSQH